MDTARPAPQHRLETLHSQGFLLRAHASLPQLDAAGLAWADAGDALAAALQRAGLAARDVCALKVYYSNVRCASGDAASGAERLSRALSLGAASGCDSRSLCPIAVPACAVGSGPNAADTALVELTAVA